MKIGRYGLAVCAALTTTLATHADIIWSNNGDAWKAAVGQHSAIDFTGFADGTPITGQYASEGVIFTNFVFAQHGDFWSDGAGLFGENGIKFTFATPQHAVAVDFLGAIALALFNDGQFVGSTPSFGNINLFSGFCRDRFISTV